MNSSITWEKLGEAGEQKVTREETHMPTIDKKEAYESIYSAEMEGIATNVNMLSIFGDNTMGMIILAVKEVAWPTFQNNWPRIRDSARLR